MIYVIFFYFDRVVYFWGKSEDEFFVFLSFVFLEFFCLGIVLFKLFFVKMCVYVVISLGKKECVNFGYNSEMLIFIKSYNLKD